jgi:lipopolysaccharide/colanic/teichoic acid biosynthesis glycosyltransferase
MFAEVLRVADLSVMLVALAAALFLTQPYADQVTAVRFLTDKIRPINLVFLACLCVFWPLLLEQTGVLRPWRRATAREEVRAVAVSVSLGALVLLVLVVLFGRERVTPGTILVFWALALGGTAFVHLGFRALARRMRHVSDVRHVLIVGSGARAQRVARGLEEQKDMAGYRLLGFVDDPERVSAAFGAAGLELPGGNGHPNGNGNGTGLPAWSAQPPELVTTIAELPTFLKDHVVDEVIVTLPIKSSYERIWEVSRICEDQGILVRIPSDLFDLRIARRAVSEVGQEPALTYYTGVAPEPWQLVAKRLMDVAGSLVLLALLSPVLLAAAAAVKVTSPGPVLFRQERLGINKRRFRMLKFRTMVEGAESLIAELEAMNEAEGPVFKLRNDPRVTKVGAFLRRTSIDELPQLFNVLRGEMSLVGPRPLPVRDYLGFEAEWHKRRFSVKPGITCLWQISGRSNVGFDEWIRMDLDYIDRWSFGLDLQILLRTIPAVLRREGAA